MRRYLPSFKFEDEQVGFVIVGVDEVGRGAIAGCVVAGAVVLPGDQAYWLGLGIDDSKKLSAKKRENLGTLIQERAIWGLGEVGVAFINRYGIVKATEKAMRAAIKSVYVKSRESKRHFLLLDAFNVKNVPNIGLRRQKAIIKGDQKSISIAAASIIAKVYRDNLMIELDKKYPKLDLKTNKGYGTKKHLAAIKKYGVQKVHRKWDIGYQDAKLTQENV